MKIKQNLRQL